MDIDELKTIASPPLRNQTYVFEVDDFDALRTIQPQLAQAACEEQAGKGGRVGGRYDPVGSTRGGERHPLKKI